tara:strand:+ start:10572 stop:11453 length:882 start_codon:yes stop_codon:yes gene_type:complete
MKRYYNNDNLELDPTRLLYNNNNNNINNLLPGFNKPINKLQDDIIINNLSIRKAQPKKDLFNQEDISLEFLPKNNNNQLVPITDRNSITNYNNDKFRFKNMSQELMDKDEEIQKYKNEVYQLQIELGESRKEKSKMISYDMENKMLKDKLKEHYSLSRELTEVKHNFKREQIDNQSNYKTIELLKKIIHKQHLRLATKEYEDSDDGESEDESDISDSDETDYSSEEEDIVLKKKGKKKIVPKNIYYNTMLKNSLLKQRLPAKKIDKLMIQMKITPKTRITKKLLIDFLNNMKK